MTPADKPLDPALTGVAPKRKRAAEPLLWMGMAILCVVAGLAIAGARLAPFSPTATSDSVSQPPPPLWRWPGLLAGSLHGAGPVHWLGTDAAGFDVLSRTMAAPRTDLVIALTANIISLVAGVGLGLAAGYFQHWSTSLLLRVSDLLQSFPVFVSAMILVALAGRSWSNIIIAMAFLYTPIYLRLTRAEVVVQRRRGYVESARAIGLSEWMIALRHVMPNSLGPAAVQASVTVGFAILLTAGLSFVGAGVRPPTPEWGLMIATGSSQLVLGDWWPSLVPGVAISLTVFGFAAVGHALERRYDR